MGSKSEWDLMKIARKLVRVIANGLTQGLGVRMPGKMCVEAAVCYAMGLPHDDQPPCVHPTVRIDKITLNDMEWSTNKARAEGLREVAIAQLGSNDFNGTKFRTELIKAMRRRFKNIAAKCDRDSRLGYLACLQSRDWRSALVELIHWARAGTNAKAEIDQLLAITAQCMVDALRACKSPGVEILDQLKAEGVVPPSPFDNQKAA